MLFATILQVQLLLIELAMVKEVVLLCWTIWHAQSVMIDWSTAHLIKELSTVTTDRMLGSYACLHIQLDQVSVIKKIYN